MSPGIGEKFLLLQGEKERYCTSPSIKRRDKRYKLEKITDQLYVSLCQLSVRDLLS